METKAILCIVGALIINLTLGTFYSIGNVVPYIASYMREKGNPDVTSEHGAWITATYILGQGSFIILGAYLEQKFNNRVACIFGCLIHCTSTFLTMWAIELNFLAVILIYGLGSGLGCGSAYVSSIIAAQKWFPQNKGIFTGIIVAGFGAGGLIFTSLQTLYMNPDNSPPNNSGYFDSTVYERVPKLFLYMGLIFTFVQAIGCSLAFPPPTNEQPRDTSNSTGHPPRSPTVIDEPVLPNLNNFCSTFTYRIFYIIAAMMMLVAPGVTFVNSLGKKYGQTYIQDDRFLATVIAVAAVANALGRLTWGFLMDKCAFSTCYTIKVVLFATLITLFPFDFVLNSKTLYLIWMLGLFFGFSGTFVLFPVFIEQVFGSKYHGIIYGIMYIFLAVSSLITSLLIQLTLGVSSKEKTSSEGNLTKRIIPCVIIATLYAISWILYAFLLPVRRLENAIKRKIDLDIARTKNSLFLRQDLFPIERGTLAEKTQKSNLGLPKENSLGSIVRIREVPDDKRIKTLAHKA